MRLQFVFVVLFSLFLFSCETDLTDLGTSAQPASDAIILKIDSLNVSSSNYDVSYIYSKPDSLLLGTFIDETYGRLYADILTQIQPPVGVSYPKKTDIQSSPAADSAKVIINYRSWFGDAYSPMQVAVYQMDKKTFNDAGLYESNINPDDYCSMSKKLGSKIFTAKDYGAIRPIANSIEIPLSQDFVDGFKTELTDFYSKTDVSRFHAKFNGLYITTNFGSASLLNIRSVYLKYYYHYTYIRKSFDGLRDSTVTVKTSQDYPANEEIRTVNRFQHPDKASILSTLNANPDVNVVSAPANIYTKVSISYADLKSKLKVDNRKLLLNRAMLRINATDVKDTTLALPLITSLLMIDVDSVETFFKKRRLPSDKTSVLGTLSYEKASDNTIVYFYNFDLSKILTYELDKTNNTTTMLNYMLVPVSIGYDGSNNVKEIKQQNLMRAVKICSGTHPTKAMKLNVVYSGF
ncbi:MAG: DUF4270 domain-containing protein [Paludibacter sp.]